MTAPRPTPNPPKVCEQGQCFNPGVNDTTKEWPNQPDYIIDPDSAAVTQMGAWTSTIEPSRLCSVYVKLANGQKTSSDWNGDW